MFNQYADAQCRSVLKWILTLGCEKKTRCFVLFEERMEYVAWSLFPRKATGSRFDFVAAFFSVRSQGGPSVTSDVSEIASSAD